MKTETGEDVCRFSIGDRVIFHGDDNTRLDYVIGIEEYQLSTGLSFSVTVGNKEGLPIYIASDNDLEPA